MGACGVYNFKIAKTNYQNALYSFWGYYCIGIWLLCCELVLVPVQVLEQPSGAVLVEHTRGKTPPNKTMNKKENTEHT